ncbi:MAG: Rne/Rng family ribonuclease [Proteobacteria bacterium]|jgi:ribonuclease E|nr:Rne/Rng family ribonuclease [Pseudomonadota bacterium]
MKRMLINATHSEELRVALVDGQKIYDLDIESRAREQKKANIYKARITRVEPSLEAAFVDFGGNRHGFLPLKEISREYFSIPPSKIKGRVNIQEVVREGLEIIVQVDKEERGNKGAALTTFYSLAGRYLVLMPNNPRGGGISKRISGEERDQLKEVMSKLEIPKDMSVIVRTAGLGRSAKELQWDLDYLAQLNDAITEAAQKNRAPFLIYQESDVITRAVRDNLREDISEILIDTVEAHKQALEFVDQVMPQYADRIKLYESEVPLFNRYQIEGQIETAFEREVRLPSGGSLVIDPTEALVSVDINSARATRGADIEETALNTNLEAADEICRQLRLRDIGGLIVIDFIDMSSVKNQRAVENRMRDALELDRARVQVGRISRFGLLEMSRQRLRASLRETSGIVCPRCTGLGMIRDVESSSLAVIRMVEEEALKETSTEVRAFLPIAVSSFLLNEKRNVLSEIEERNDVRIIIVPEPEMQTPHYRVERVRGSDEAETRASYELSSTDDESTSSSAVLAKPAPAEQAAVKTVTPPAVPVDKAPEPPTAEVATRGPGLISRIFSLFSGISEESVQEDEKTSTAPTEGRSGSAGNRSRRRSGADKSEQQRGASEARDGQRGSRGRRKESSAEDENQSEGREPRRRRRSRSDGNRNDNGNGGTRGNGRSRDRDSSNRDSAREETAHTESARRNSDDNQETSEREEESRNGGSRNRDAGREDRQRRRPAARSQDDDTTSTDEDGDDKRNRGQRERGNRRRRSGNRKSPVAEVENQVVESQEATEQAEPSVPAVSATAIQVDPGPDTESQTEPAQTASSDTASEPESVSSDSRSVTPVKTQTSRSAAADDRQQPAEATREHPSVWGRAANDPRVNPGSPPSLPVLREAAPRVMPEALGYIARPLDQGHPSLLGRAANDPRQPEYGAASKDESESGPDTASGVSLMHAEGETAPSSQEAMDVDVQSEDRPLEKLR